MWLIYTAGMFAVGAFSLFSMTLGVISLIILCVPGVVVLIITYGRIYDKYKKV